MAWIDYGYYKKWMIVPLNIVLYNVFSDPSRGPNLYGTEPWHFYILNGLLNFNFVFIAALASGIVYLFAGTRNQALVQKHGWRLSFFYLWLAQGRTISIRCLSFYLLECIVSYYCNDGMDPDSLWKVKSARKLTCYFFAKRLWYMNEILLYRIWLRGHRGEC
jgi:hypothetical protein